VQFDFAGDDPLIHQPHERLVRADQAEVEQALVPEPRVQQCSNRVLHAADVEVDGIQYFSLAGSTKRSGFFGSMYRR